MVLTHTGEIHRMANMKLAPVSMLALLSAAVVVGSCGSQSNAHPSKNGGSSRSVALGRVSSTLLVKEPGQPGPVWTPVASIGAQPAAWIALRSGVTLLRFDQRLVHLALHAGAAEPGGQGWTYGDRIGASEIHRVLAAFNGGFKSGCGPVGFLADGRAAVALTVGLGSIVTYRNGTTDIGAWQQGVPASGLTVASVLQNLHLLVDRGVAAPTVENCVLPLLGGDAGRCRCEEARPGCGAGNNRRRSARVGRWRAPLTDHDRAGIDRCRCRARGRARHQPRVDRGYLYVRHGSSRPTGVPVVPGQLGIAGRLLAPYSRVFFTILAN